MDLHELLDALSAKLQSRPLNLDPNNLCRLIIDDLEMFIELMADHKTVYIYSPIGYLPPNGREAIFEDVMHANLFHSGTGGGAVFGYDQTIGDLLLHQKFSLDSINADEFVTACSTMVETSKTWRNKLLNQGVQVESEPSRLNFMEQGKRPDLESLRSPK